MNAGRCRPTICRLSMLLLWMPACGTAEEAVAVDQVWRSALRRIDLDGNGSLSFQEFGAPGPDGRRLRKADRSGDGEIDEDEWVAMVLRQPPRRQRDLREILGREWAPASAVHALSDEEIEARRVLFRRTKSTPKREGPPNILIIGMDTVRADHLSVYGYPRNTTPHLASLATRGVVFEQSIANANESLYSHAAIWTSRYPSEVARPVYETYVIPDEAVTMAEVLQTYGYQTGGFVAGGHLDPGFGHAQGFDTFAAEVGFGSFWNTVPSALAWLDERDASRPWFAFVHSYDAHAPYQTLPMFAHIFAGRAPPYPVDRLMRDPMFPERIVNRRYYPGKSSFFHHPKGFNILSVETYRALEKAGKKGSVVLSEGDVAHLNVHYDGCLAYADMQVGMLLAALEQRGLRDNTMVIVLSDHGEDLLNHSFVNHRTGLTDSIVRVPTIVVGPGFPARSRVETQVEALDILPTVLRAAGGVVPAGARGRALQDVVSGTAPHLAAVFSEGVMDQLSVRTETHKLIASGFPLAAPDLVGRLAKAALESHHFAYYDLTADPHEQHNLLESPKPTRLAEAQRLRAGLVRWRMDLALGTATQDRSRVDPAVAEQMRRHGYWAADQGPQRAESTAP